MHMNEYNLVHVLHQTTGSGNRVRGVSKPVSRGPTLTGTVAGEFKILQNGQTFFKVRDNRMFLR